jgi:hypothetical protein
MNLRDADRHSKAVNQHLWIGLTSMRKRKGSEVPPPRKVGAGSRGADKDGLRCGVSNISGTSLGALVERFFFAVGSKPAPTIRRDLDEMVASATGKSESGGADPGSVILSILPASIVSAAGRSTMAERPT